MVLRTYEIPYSKGTREFVIDYPNRLEMITSKNGIVVSIDHPNVADEILFREEVTKRIGIKSDSDTNFVNAARFIDEIKTDQLLYMSSRQVTKTNIGTTFVNLFTDFSGRPFFADFTGFTKLAFQTYWTKIGTGSQHLRIVDDSGVIVTPLINTENLGGGTGLVTGDNPLANFTIPAEYVNFKGKLRIQVRSTVAADDPVFEGINIYLRR